MFERLWCLKNEGNVKWPVENALDKRDGFGAGEGFFCVPKVGDELLKFSSMDGSTISSVVNGPGAAFLEVSCFRGGGGGGFGGKGVLALP